MNLALNQAPADVQELLREWPLGFMFGLPPDSTIVVVGAFKGRSIDLLSWLYPDYSTIIGLEPQVDIAREAQERFILTRNIRIQSMGLGTHRTPPALRVSNPGTVHASMVEELGATSDNHIHMLDAAMFFAESDKQKIDLLVMNIEGFEYILLPYMQDIGAMQQIDRLAVQFHPTLEPKWSEFEDDSCLRTTHHLLVDDYPRWQYWVRRNA